MSGDSLYSRKYGQVILKNAKVAMGEVRDLNLDPGSHVLEIGPGPGTLTGHLLEKGYKVTAVESDHRFVEELKILFTDEIKAGNLVLIKGNIMEFKSGYFDGIIGNVPYHISSEIVFRLSDFDFKRAILMFQKEFAERLTAKVGTKSYSRLTVNAQLRYNAKIVGRVSRNSFFPVPGVDSAIVSIELKKEFPNEKIQAADKIFQKLFSARRKKISSTFRNVSPEYADKRPGDLSPLELYNLAFTVLPYPASGP